MFTGGAGLLTHGHLVDAGEFGHFLEFHVATEIQKTASQYSRPHNHTGEPGRVGSSTRDEPWFLRLVQCLFPA